MVYGAVIESAHGVGRNGSDRKEKSTYTMIGSLLGLLSTDMAIDLGTANTLVYVKGQGVQLD